MKRTRRLDMLFVLVAGCAVAETPTAGGVASAPRSSTVSAPVCGTSPAADGAAPGAKCLGTAGGPETRGSRNVLGGSLRACPSRHATGFYRDGFCDTGADDLGVHVVCARVTDAFLAYSRSRGNDLLTPRGGFPGLKDGDGWCLCASRWQEAHAAGVAPPVVLDATHEAALRTSRLEHLRRPKGP